jgi:endonuclease YncB( thermonuclease family)
MNNNVGRGEAAESRGRRNPRWQQRGATLSNNSVATSSRGDRCSREWTARRVLLIFGFMVLAAPAIPPPAVLAAGPAQVTPAPTIEEWLNQPVRLQETAQALDLPAAGGKPAGEIRAGAEITAIGLVAGKSWVQIELPNHAIAYLPRSAIQFETGGPAAAPAPAAPSKIPPGAAPAAAATPANAPASDAGAIHGTVSKVANAATLVVADQRIRLLGIDPGPQTVLAPFEKWVEAQGALDCRPEAQTGRYRCLTSGGIDVAQAAILNGSGRVGDGASPTYRDSETQARDAKRGLWGLP